MASYAKLSVMPDVFAGPGDYVAAFDPRGNCVGVEPIFVGGAYLLDIYGQNIVAGVGMANGENFRLVVWDHNTGIFYTTASTIPGWTAISGGGNIPAFLLQTFLTNTVDVLPVDLFYFNATPKSSDVLLEWATASELNNDFFEVQRSADGRDFEVLGKVAGAGTHSGLLTYDFTDRSPRPGLNYYRLRQVDFDGAFEYSPVVSVKAAGKEDGMALYPNPAGEYVEVSLPAEWSEGETELFLRDVSGRVLRQMQFSNVDGPLRMSTEDLPGGYYTLQASNGRELLSERVVVMGKNR